jgi:hypothetical protein
MPSSDSFITDAIHGRVYGSCTVYERHSVKRLWKLVGRLVRRFDTSCEILLDMLPAAKAHMDLSPESM